MSEGADLSQPTFIVTGAGGFVGSNLAAELLRRAPDAFILAIDDCSSGSFANLVEACARKGAGPFTGDFLAWKTQATPWEALIGEFEPAAVFHLAANTETTVAAEAKMLEDNTGGFDEMLLACAEGGVPLVYASSAATYGSPPQARDRQPFPESAAGFPENVYGFSKWIMENRHRTLAQSWEAEHGRAAHVVGLRYFNVYGPGESRKGKMASMAYQLAQQITRGGRPRIFADGSQARDQVHVDDVVNCTLSAANEGVRAGVYNCGSGRATTFNEVVDAVRAGLGVSAEDCPTDYFEMPESIRAFYQDFTCADMRAASEGLRWKPTVSGREAMARYAGSLAESADGSAAGS